MCGIWALFGLKPEQVFQYAPESFKVRHRGPDASRFETIQGVPGVGLGFHHLSIMDHAQGMQPMRIKKYKHLYLIYNGEIYNYKQLQTDHGFEYETESDGESIIHLYAQGGVNMAMKNLDGMYGICLIDTQLRLIHIGRDPYGIKPLFRVYDERQGILGVCSEAKGLVKRATGEGHNLKIEYLQAGCYQTYKMTESGRVDFVGETRYYNIGDFPTYTTCKELDPTDVHQNIRTLLKAAVKKRTMANRRVGCLLSGGLDSSLVAALLMKISKEVKFPHPIQTFSIGFPGSPDMVAARKVADFIGSEHHEVVMDETTIDAYIDATLYTVETYEVTMMSSGIATYILCKYIKENTDTTVIMSGEGSDELCQGYCFFHNVLGPSEADILSRHCLELMSYNSVLRADRVSSAHGLELRVPFLDAQFTAYFLSLSMESRMPQRGSEKYLLRKAFADTGLLPDDILWRQKEEFGHGITTAKNPISEILLGFISHKVPDNWEQEAPRRFPYNTPSSKHEYYMRTVFEQNFPDQDHLQTLFFFPDNLIDPERNANYFQRY